MIDVVIVNWNSGQQILDCLDSLFSNHADVIRRVVVVDNDSTDGSAETLEKIPMIDFVPAGQNLGFGAACNIGAKSGSAPYILFLNPDTRVEGDSLRVPLDFMECKGNERVGICGIQLVDEENCISRTCARRPTPFRLVASALGLDKIPGFSSTGMAMKEWGHDSSRQVDQVMGAFFFCRRNVFESCGGFDERFFVYFEEVDLARRSRLLGWRTYYLAEARAFHAGGGTSRQVKARRLFYSLRSRVLYSFKHFSTLEAWSVLVVTLLIEPFTRSIWCLAHRDLAGIRHTWSAYWMLFHTLGHVRRGEGRYNP